MELGFQVLQDSNMQMQTPQSDASPPPVPQNTRPVQTGGPWQPVEPQGLPRPATNSLGELSRLAATQVGYAVTVDAAIRIPQHREFGTGAAETMVEHVSREVANQIRRQFPVLVHEELPTMAQKMARDWITGIMLANPEECQRLAQTAVDRAVSLLESRPQALLASSLFDEMVRVMEDSRMVRVVNSASPPVSNDTFKFLRIKMANPLQYPTPYGILERIAARVWHAAVSHKSPLCSFEGFAILVRPQGPYDVYYWQIPERWALEVDCVWKGGGWSIRTKASKDGWIPELFSAIDTYGSQTLHQVEDMREAREWLGNAHDNAVRKVKRGIWDELKTHFDLHSLTAARGVQEGSWGRSARHCTHQTRLHGLDGTNYLWLATNYTVDRGFFMEAHFPDEPWKTEGTEEKARSVTGVVATAYGRDTW